MRVDGRHRLERPGQDLDQADDQRQEHDPQEEVGGDGENLPTFLHPAQIDHGHEDDHAHRDLDLDGQQARKGRGDLRHTSGDTHGDGQDVVGQQGRAGDLGRQLAEVIPRDDVGPAAVGIGEDRLPVGDRHDRQQHGNRDRDRDGDAQQRGPSPGETEDDQDFFCGVGRGRQCVRRKNGQPHRPADGLVGQVRRHQRTANQKLRQRPFLAAITVRSICHIVIPRFLSYMTTYTMPL